MTIGNPQIGKSMDTINKKIQKKETTGKTK
jgi:hypothetical protein